MFLNIIHRFFCSSKYFVEFQIMSAFYAMSTKFIKHLLYSHLNFVLSTHRLSFWNATKRALDVYYSPVCCFAIPRCRNRFYNRRWKKKNITVNWKLISEFLWRLKRKLMRWNEVVSRGEQLNCISNDLYRRVIFSQSSSNLFVLLISFSSDVRLCLRLPDIFFLHDEWKRYWCIDGLTW